MKIKLKDEPISLKSGWCFLKSGYSLSLIQKINEGKEVVVDKIPSPATEYVDIITTKKGDK